MPGISTAKKALEAQVREPLSWSAIKSTVQQAGSICIKNWELKKTPFVVKSLFPKKNYEYAWIAKYLQASCC